ncbi:AAA family ATPase [Variovorax paradoxus]|uniref:AAA family ATPase n=1 Tax=Variovorax paradoxus TaxID=34073 RepID=UPI003D6489ED
MNNNFPAGGVYICAGPGGRPPDVRLRLSLLIVIDRIPDKDSGQVLGELYWCDDEQEPQLVGPTHFVRANESDTTSEDSFRKAEIVSISEFERNVCEFATFLGSRRSYRLLIDLAGRPAAKRLLLRARDLAALQAFAQSSRILRVVREQGGLSRILQKSEEQFAFLAFEKIFNEDQFDNALPPSVELVQAELEIEPGTILEFIADYGEVLGEVQPINVVIGANGMGKTRLLLAIAGAAQRLGLKVSGGEFDPDAQVRAEPSDILSFTYESTLWSKYRRSGVVVVGLGVGTKQWKELTSVVVELALTDSSDFQIRAYVEVLRPIVDPDELFVPVATPMQGDRIRSIDGRSFISLTALADAPRSLIALIDPSREIIAWSTAFGRYQLSSGQRSLLLMTAQLFLHGQRAIVLIDEPENHLHPQYVTLLMRTLQSTLIAMESRAVVVTHSPFVVRELDKSAIQILGKDAAGLPCLYQTTLQTFGGDVGQISEYVFGDHEVEKGYEVLIQRALARSSPSSRHEVARLVSTSLGDDGELYLQKILNDENNAN